MAGIDNLKPVDSIRAAEIGALGGHAKKGKKHVSTWIQNLLDDDEFTTTVRQGLEIKEYKGAPMKAIILAQIHLAVNGDVKAADLLFKYGYGQKQEIDVTTKGEAITQPMNADMLAQFLNNAKEQTKQ